MRATLIALVFAVWAPIASACVEAQPLQPQGQPSMQMPMAGPCELAMMQHAMPACECLHAMVGLRAAPAESERFILAGSAGAGTPLFAGRRALPDERLARQFGEIAPDRPLYLITSRLRL